MNYLQQGDVLLFSNEVMGSSDFVETTLVHKGDTHSHYTDTPIKTNGEVYYVERPTILRHHEHRPLLLKEGFYRKQIVLETDIKTQIPRPVVD